MDYITDRDLAYLRGKYHDPETYDPDKRNRYLLRDCIFDPTTGLSGDELVRLIAEEDAARTHLPHSLRKAYALRTVMEKQRINCDGRDYFPAIHSTDRRPIGQLVRAWKEEVFKVKYPHLGRERTLLEGNAIVTAWPDFDHNIPVWDVLFEGGIPGVIANVRAAREKKAAEAPLNERQEAFYESVILSYESILLLMRRMRALADSLSEPSEKTPALIAALDSLLAGGPGTLYEALLLIYLYFMVSEHVENLQVRSLSNFDRQLAPFYYADLAAGKSEEEERIYLAYFFYQFQAIDNYWGQPMYLGGTNPDGTTVINDFSYIILDVYDRMGLMNPKIQIKFSPSSPKEFYLKALDMIRRGHSSIVFVCEETIVKSLMKAGFSEAEARRCDISGCYETKMPGGASCGMNYLNLVKPLEILLHGGRDAITGQVIVPDCPTDFPTVESLFEAYKQVLAAIIGREIALVNAFENDLAEMCPQPLLAGTFRRSLEMACDPYEGSGVTNNSCLMLGFLANIADSFAMLDKYVYQKKELSLAEFTAILDKNWEGAELLRARILADPDHYGNNRELPDSYARAITRFVSDYVMGRPNAENRGGYWTVGLHVARQSYDQGRRTLATPDGRRTGEELSKNASASMGMNKAGATAAILSVTKLDTVSLPGDCPLDLGLLPSAVSGEDGLEAMYGLLSAFHHLGGHAMHINVFNADTLRAAQKDPEKYADLQIRVCGWNVLFRTMAKEEQDGFIRQAEALV